MLAAAAPWGPNPAMAALACVRVVRWAPHSPLGCDLRGSRYSQNCCRFVAPASSAVELEIPCNVDRIASARGGRVHQ